MAFLLFLAVERLLECVPNVGWACVQCGYSCSLDRKPVIIRHIETIHLKISYPCLYCELTFTRVDKRKEHIKTVHRINIRPRDIADMARARGLPR